VPLRLWKIQRSSLDLLASFIMIRVLVVDDNDDLRSLLKAALEAAGYSVEVASDGHTALMLQSAFPADIVVTDLFMPQGDGFDAILALRQNFPNVKIIVISGDTPLIKADPVNAARSLGVDAAFPKPFELAVLIKAVGSMTSES